jgi:hypothetical protein
MNGVVDQSGFYKAEPAENSSSLMNPGEWDEFYPGFGRFGFLKIFLLPCYSYYPFPIPPI